MPGHRTRLLSSRPARDQRQLSPHVGADELDLDACRALLFAVLETAIRDYRYLEEIGDRTQLGEADRKRVRAMTEDNHPAEFFDSEWFDDVCHLLRLTPDAVRDVAGWKGDEPLQKAS